MDLIRIISQLQSELDSLNDSSQKLEEVLIILLFIVNIENSLLLLPQEMKQDPMKQKALGLYDELYKLQQKKSELDSEIQKAQVSTKE